MPITPAQASQATEVLAYVLGLRLSGAAWRTVDNLVENLALAAEAGDRNRLAAILADLDTVNHRVTRRLGDDEPGLAAPGPVRERVVELIHRLEPES